LSKGQGSPSRPGTPSTNQSMKKKEKSVISGVAIAGIVIGVLAVIIILLALCKRKSSKPSSHFIDEEKHSQGSSSFVTSQELPKDSGANVNKESKGDLFLLVHVLNFWNT